MIATATADKPVTFLVLFAAEALAWAGVPALGAAAIGAAGVLAQQGVVHLWSVIVVGTLGGWVGGFGGWWLGRHLARAGLEDGGGGRFADRRRSALDSGQHFAARWGKFMVFFVPSWVSGAMGTPLRTFAVWNFLAAFLWTMGASLAAYGIGSALSGGDLTDVLVPLAIAALALGAIVLLLRRRVATRG